MKDEIKEIERILATSGKYITYAERCYVLDYITNLQEENEKLKENAIHNDKVVNKAKWNEMLYKSRNEKAKDKMKQLQEENEKLKKLKNLYREKFISNFCANNRALKCIEDFLCTEEYIKSDPEATANNYVELLNILKSETQENLYKYTPEKGFRLVGDDNE